MKKFLLIALISGSAIAANAQSPFDTHNNNRNNHQTAIVNDGNHHRQDLDSRIAEINRNYDGKIADLNHKPFMRTKDRRKQIKQLEKERKTALNQCKESFSAHNGSMNHSHRS